MVKRTRNKSITLRMTEKELEQFQKLQEKSQTKNQTDFIMQLLEEKQINIYTDLVPVLVELKRQGNNLNQLTRRLNEGSGIGAEAKEVLASCYAVYEKLLALEVK